MGAKKIKKNRNHKNNFFALLLQIKWTSPGPVEFERSLPN